MSYLCNFYMHVDSIIFSPCNCLAHARTLKYCNGLCVASFDLIMALPTQVSRIYIFPSFLMQIPKASFNVSDSSEQSYALVALPDRALRTLAAHNRQQSGSC